MVVSKDKKRAIFGLYCMRSNVNQLPGFIKLAGLDDDFIYKLRGEEYYGDELMNLGLALKELNTESLATGQDFISYVEVIETKE